MDNENIYGKIAQIIKEAECKFLSIFSQVNRCLDHNWSWFTFL